jgi:23S rRNA (guanosine2251-2'-O)-methyltransferase
MRKLSTDELDRITADEFKSAKKTPITIILDDIRSLHNIGSVFRTADAFILEKIYLCGITACPPNKEIHKTALGATESVDWEYAKDVTQPIQLLKSKGTAVYAVEQAEGSVMLHDFAAAQTKPLALVFGNEVFGVSQKAIEICDGAIEIPQLGTKHSLNIAVSAGIVIWELFKKLKRPD